MKKTFALIVLASLATWGCSSSDDTQPTDAVTTECPTSAADADTDASASDAGDPDAVAPVDQDADTDAAVPPADAAAE